MKEIKLFNQPEVILVDDEDYQKLSSYNWKLVNRAVRSTSLVPISITWIIKSKPQKGYIWDHTDRNILNNQKENLRLATYSENAANRKKFTGFSKYKGVRKSQYNPNLFDAVLNADGYRYGKYGFKTQEEAALEYNRMAERHFGEFAVLNEI